MVFALENADAAGDVVEVLEEALSLAETPPATKLARLYLVNDILANATAPVRNASRWVGWGWVGWGARCVVLHDDTAPVRFGWMAVGGALSAEADFMGGNTPVEFLLAALQSC